MKIFMLGWEFPPFISGGLGTACYGLTKAMSNMGMEVLFVLPRSVEQPCTTHVNMLTPDNITDAPMLSIKYDKLRNVEFRAVESLLMPYQKKRRKRFLIFILTPNFNQSISFI